jgi:hypothetical protein
MDHVSKFSKLAICAGVAFIAFGSIQAHAFDVDDDITITTLTPGATATISQDMDWGSFTVIPHPTDTVSLVMDGAGAVTAPGGMGAPGQARFIGTLAGPRDPLIFALTGALPVVDMSFQIGAPGAGPGQFAGADVTLAGGAGTGTFVANTWTCAVSATAAGTTTAEVLTGFDGTTGLATLTTGDLAGDGVASITCGATLTTVAGTDPYTGGAYTGNVRFAVNY